MKLIILDRDGVINHDSDAFIKSTEEWKPIKGSLEAIAQLTLAGYNIVIISNQSGIGRKLFTLDQLNTIHLHMLKQVKQNGGQIESILFCPHHPNDNCDCRKPKTGLYTTLSQRLNIHFKDIFSVGDSLRDLQAAHTAGATPVLVHTGNGKITKNQITKNKYLSNILQFKDLLAFSDYVLKT